MKVDPALTAYEAFASIYNDFNASNDYEMLAWPSLIAGASEAWSPKGRDAGEPCRGWSAHLRHELALDLRKWCLGNREVEHQGLRWVWSGRGEVAPSVFEAEIAGDRLAEPIRHLE